MDYNFGFIFSNVLIKRLLFSKSPLMNFKLFVLLSDNSSISFN